jgi:nucleoside-diphosphate-sugar epimerase
MSTLIVGGGSFIGSWVVRELLRAGERVVAYDVDVRDNAIHRALSVEELRRVTFVPGDVLDVVGLLHIAREHGVRDIVHLAAALIPTCEAQPALGVRVNVDGLNHVLEVARVIGARRVVWASSIAIYGPQSRYPGAPDEDAPHWPTTVYGATKSINEYMAAHYFEKFGVDSIGLRFTVVYGPWRMRGALAYQLGHELLEKPAHGQPARVPAGDGLVNWQHVEDAAQAILLSLRHDGPTKSRVFNTGGEALRVRDAAAIVRRLLPDARIEVGPGDAEGIARLSIERAKAELGYAPRYDFAAGARQTINEYRRRQGLSLI